MIETVCSGGTCLFVSPHLDDAILSCGGLIKKLAETNPVVVATVFTTASQGPYTLSARSFLRQCGERDPVRLFEERRREDVTVVQAAGAEPVHFGLTDALFRTWSQDAPAAWWRRLVPEAAHVYPTHRLHIARGVVSAADAMIVDRAAALVEEVASRLDVDATFFPLAIGNHVDHVITRMVSERYTRRKTYYADFPYVLSGDPDPDFIRTHRLDEVVWPHGSDDRRRLINGYVTQTRALFPSGDIPVAPERYYSALGANVG